MTLHILKKDVRRLWPAILVSLVVLGGLAWHDRWRTDAIAGGYEEMLSLLTGVVWALLLGLAVGQEPIAGDRHFWLTRPYSRWALLGAKLLFAALFVHAPSLLADCVILAGRGFPPSEYAGQLLWKQALLACALTLPALAVGSLVRNFTQFVLALVGVALGLVLWTGSLGEIGHFQIYWEPLRNLRREIAFLFAAVAAAIVLVLQYSARRVAWSRAIGTVGGVSAAMVFSWLLPHTALAIRTTSNPAPSTPSLRLDLTPRPRPLFGVQRDVVIVLPVAVEGVAPGEAARLDSVRSEIEAADGRRYNDEMAVTRRQYQSRSYGLSITNGPEARGHWWIYMNFDPATYAAIESAPVTLRGEIGATMIRNGDPAWLSVGEAREVQGIGRCAALLTVDRWAERIKVICEAPRIEAPSIPARLWSPELHREWRAAMSMRSTVPLSPLDRIQSSLAIAPEPPRANEGRVPASAVATARIEVIPQEVLGYAAVRYEFRNLDLRQYRIKPF